MLFLLVLLLPAPMLAGGGRWRQPAGARTALKRMGPTTIAFAAAVAFGALSPVHPPARLAGAIIAAGVLAGSAHAIRPIFPGREPFVAAVFGLALTPSSLPRTELLLLLTAGLAVPTLIVASRLPMASAIRVTGATIAAILGGCLLLGHLGVTNPIATAVDGLGAHPAPLLVTLAVLADAAGLYALIDRRRTAALEARLRRSARDVARHPSPRTPQDPLLAARPHGECR
ncbi:hypothetical protein ACFY36_40060 [Actinoplanes sp. NPDC000266]